MTTAQIGFAQGTLGIVGLTLGGILGGIAVARHGLRRWLWPMVWAISLPDIVYVYLSYAQPDNLIIVNSCIFVEQFGYGFGFTAYMLYLIYFANGTHKTSHYAICTAFMALGHDAAGHDSRLDARNPRLPAVLHLDYGVHTGHLRRYRPAENRP